ncbi:MAG: Bor family protein [Bacteroidota bacterium]
MMSSCYTYTYTVGNGPQSNVEVKEKNHYFIYGLAQGRQSDPVAMSGGAENYRVKIEHTFVDGVLNAITFGIYTPTTTTVTK